MRTKIALSCAVLFLTGCSFAPQMKTPKVELPNIVSQKTVKIDTQWWKGFGDENLNLLIEEALKNNDDLRLAVVNVKKARAIYGISEAQMYPQLNLGADATRESRSANSYPSSFGGTYNNFSLSASVSYELDFWGSVRDREKANFATLLATDAQKDALEIALVSDVASYYFKLVADLAPGTFTFPPVCGFVAGFNNPPFVPPLVSGTDLPITLPPMSFFMLSITDLV